MASEFKFVKGVKCKCDVEVGQLAQAMRHARMVAASKDLGNLCINCYVIEKDKDNARSKD